MKWIGLAVVLLISLGLHRRVVAEEQDCRWWLRQWRALRQPCPCCPDDYCKKPLPAVCPAHWEGCNDYDKKPLPMVHPLEYCGPDDYCKKRYTGMDFNPCPPWASFYSCGSSVDNSVGNGFNQGYRGSQEFRNGETPWHAPTADPATTSPKAATSSTSTANGTH